MDETKDGMKSGMNGKCPMCGGNHTMWGCWGGMHRRGPWSIVIRIIILIIVFWIGMQVGEHRTLRGGYMMRGGFGGGRGGYMMGGYGGYDATAPATTTTP